MDPMVLVALLSAIQGLAKTYFDLSGKTDLVLTKADLDTKTPEELFAEQGVVLPK